MNFSLQYLIRKICNLCFFSAKLPNFFLSCGDSCSKKISKMYNLPDQSEKSREPENENGDPGRWQQGGRDCGLQRTSGQFLTSRTSSAWRRGLTPGSNSSRISLCWPAGACLASSWWRATGGPRCWSWPPPWSRRTWGCSG